MSMLPCLGVRQDPSALCGTLIGIAVNIGPAAFRCPVCNSIYILDPVAPNPTSIEVEGHLEVEGHQIEICGGKILPVVQSNSLELESFVVMKVGDLKHVYRAPVYSDPGQGFEFFGRTSP